MTDDRTAADIHRRTAMKALGGAGATGVLSSARFDVTPSAKPNADGESRRNIVFTLSDDHRYDFLSCLDEPGTPSFIETPGMDRMARQGARFANASVSTPLCAPSRATILTGQYARQHGVVDNQKTVTKNDVFFPELLQQAGYETAFIGKWHTYQSNSAAPRPGFDHWVSFEGQGQYFNPTLNVDGKRIKRSGYITDLLTEYATEWIRGRDGKRPFFLYLSHKAPHYKFKPAPRHVGTYSDAPIERPRTMADTKATYRGKPEWVRKQRDSVRGVDNMFDGMGYEALYRRYSETLLALDESIAAVSDCLDETGFTPETLQLYMGDNGFHLGEHGLVGKQTAYEQSIRVPLLASAPGMIDAGTVVNRPVLNVDIAPTLLAEAGHEIPDSMAGQSFLPLLDGERAVDRWRNATFHESFWGGKPPRPTVFSLRAGRYKYIWYRGLVDATDELYDLRKDPLERHNLIERSGHRKVAEKLHTRLFDRLEAVGPMRVPIRRRPRRPDENRSESKNGSGGKNG